MCRIPVLNVDELVKSFGKKRRRRQAAEGEWGAETWEGDTDWAAETWDLDENFSEEDFENVADFSVTSSYPQPYCSRISDLKSACFEESILELWANKGAFDEIAEANIASLTKQSILEKLNSVTGNYR